MNSWNNPESEPYKPFPGPSNREMPKLIAEGRNPISPSLVLWRRLEVLNNYLGALKIGDAKSAAEWKNVMETWWDNYVDTGFGVARHPKGNVVLVPNAQYLRQLNLKTKLPGGYVVMPDGMFESLDGYGFTAKQIEQYGNRLLSQKQALVNPFWEAFIPDKTLRGASIVNTFAQGKQRSEYDEMMGVNFPYGQKKPVMGIVSVGGLGNWSSAYGGNGLLLDNCDPYYLDFGRLMGVSPGVEVGDVRGLEYIIQPK